MQDPSAFSAMRQEQDVPQFPEQEQHLKCPRCDSTNTKFCYYNNYNLSQPRHFCKSCRRYWTKGGALRNIPVGGGTRKNSKRSTTDNTNVVTNPTKRSSLSTNPASPTPFQMPKFESLVPSLPQLFPISGEHRIESFGSFLNPNGDHGSLVGNFHHGGDGAFSHNVVLSISNSSIVNNNNNNYGSESSSLPYNPPSAPPPSENYWNMVSMVAVVVVVLVVEMGGLIFPSEIKKQKIPCSYSPLYYR